MTPEFSERVDAVQNLLRQVVDFEPDIGIIIGSGLEFLLAKIDVFARIDYADITGFPAATAPSHRGELIFGTLLGRKIIAQNGRGHLYEGLSADDIVLPIYVMRALGVKTVVITNAAGGLSDEMKVADAVLIEDHLNFTGLNPLTGLNDDRLGPRFPDMSRAYDLQLREAAQSAAKTVGQPLKSAIYAAVHGPDFETNAERRYLRMAGADLVGMSTALEVIAANHAGLRVLAFSAVTNSAIGGPDQMPDSIEEVVKNAAIAAKKIQLIILEMIKSGDF